MTAARQPSPAQVLRGYLLLPHAVPVIVVMVVVGALLVFAQGSALAPFIYTIF